MKQLLATISNIKPLTTNRQILTFDAPNLPQMRAGQLVLIRVNDEFDPYLRRAYFPLPHPHTPILDLLIANTDPLTRKAIGEALDLIAPVGNGFTLDANTRRLLLVGDEPNFAPLIGLAHEATQKQIAVTLLVVSQMPIHPPTLATLLPIDVEYQFASDIQMDILRWADQVCAAGTAALYTQLKQGILQSALVVPSGFVQVIVAPEMACGFGVCLSCAVETTHGVRLACVDGPVFELFDSLMVG